jgi:hypothetical protein
MSGEQSSGSAAGAAANATSSGTSTIVAGSTDQSAGGTVVQSSDTESSADATSEETSSGDDGDTSASGTTVSLQPAVAPQFQERLKSSASTAYHNNVEAKAKTPLTDSPQGVVAGFKVPLNEPPLQGSPKAELGKGYERNPRADELEEKYGADIKRHYGEGDASGSFSSSASELQSVLQSMYNLGRLIKRMPDDKLETRKETPSPTPAPYAFARRFEPFGKGTSAI